jgi:hypothetical protein
MPNTASKAKIRIALRRFINKDKKQLLNVYEPTISHRIAVYMEPLFREYDVDCEYNKHLLNAKKVYNGSNIRPDIIIHKRMNDERNSIAFEIKKNGVSSKLAKADIRKLKEGMIDTLHYDMGVFIGILKSKVEICWIEKDGEEIVKNNETLFN